MKSKQNNLVKINNNVLKKTDNIITITNKIISEIQQPTEKDFEWWDELDDNWKKIFNFYINKPKHEIPLIKAFDDPLKAFDDRFIGGNHYKEPIKIIEENGITERPNKTELKTIINLKFISIDENKKIKD